VIKSEESVEAAPVGTVVRLAAAADLRVTVAQRGRLRSRFASLPEVADVLLLAGGLTASGLVSEAETLVDELDGLGVPIVAVLGAGDHEAGQEVPIRAALTSMGWKILEADATVVEAAGARVGIAGMTGFAGGFGLDYQLWTAVREHRAADRERSRAERFGRALTGLSEQNTDIRVALTHFSPILATLEGEREAGQANLGNELLGEIIDAAKPHVAVHGMARHGRSKAGRTARGIPVYNVVARPVLGQAFTVLSVRVPAYAR
jgi:Icc-related predicted phosphoesterase